MGVLRRPRSPYWWLWLRGKGLVKTEIPIGVTKTEQKESRASAESVYHAKALAIGRIAEGFPEDKPRITFKLFADWYDLHILTHHRGAVREREILKSLRATFDPLDLTLITKDAVLEWRTRRAHQTSASTSNRELDLLKQMLAAAVPTYLTVSPIVRLKRLRPLRRETATLSREDETRLLAVVTPADRALLICAMDTLMRLSDIVNLKREQDHGGHLTVVDPKVEPYRVPVSTRLRAALDALPQNGPYYFAHRRAAEKARDYRGSVRQMLEAACKKCTPKIKYGRKVGGITFHGLRHTGTTRLIEAGISLRIVQEIGGWRSLRQLERYAHPSEPMKRAAVEAIAPAPAKPRLVPKKKRRTARVLIHRKKTGRKVRKSA